MSKLNKSLVNDLQSLTFEEKLEDVYKTIDLNYLGYNRLNKKSSLLKYGTDANVNRILLWLSSKKYDYVREPDKGGVLYSLLGKSNSEINIEEAEDHFKRCFTDEFTDYFDLLILKLIPQNKQRKITIYMVVFDRITLSTFTVSTEASL